MALQLCDSHSRYQFLAIFILQAVNRYLSGSLLCYCQTHWQCLLEVTTMHVLCSDLPDSNFGPI